MDGVVQVYDSTIETKVIPRWSQQSNIPHVVFNGAMDMGAQGLIHNHCEGSIGRSRDNRGVGDAFR